MKDILEELCELRRRDAESRQREIPLKDMLATAGDMPAPPDFSKAFSGPGM